jgi:hypothetical protein
VPDALRAHPDFQQGRAVADATFAGERFAALSEDLE